LRVDKSIIDDVYQIMLKGDFKRKSNLEDTVYYLDQHIMKVLGISLYDLLNKNEMQDNTLMKKYLWNNHNKVWS
jgi:hypothetical protein